MISAIVVLGEKRKSLLSFKVKNISEALKISLKWSKTNWRRIAIQLRCDVVDYRLYRYRVSHSSNISAKAKLLAFYSQFPMQLL